MMIGVVGLVQSIEKSDRILIQRQQLRQVWSLLQHMHLKTIVRTVPIKITFGCEHQSLGADCSTRRSRSFIASNRDILFPRPKQLPMLPIARPHVCKMCNDMPHAFEVQSVHFRRQHVIQLQYNRDQYPHAKKDLASIRARAYHAA